MQKYLTQIREYVATHKSQVIQGTFFGVVVVFLVTLFVYDNTPHYTYQPTNACDILTPEIAMDVLGDKVTNIENKKLVADKDTMISSCNYADDNKNDEAKKLITMSVRSAVRDAGLLQNTTDFAAYRNNNEVEKVEGLGQEAYYVTANSQLNVLDGRRWVKISIVHGSQNESVPLSETVKLAKKVLAVQPKA